VLTLQKQFLQDITNRLSSTSQVCLIRRHHRRQVASCQHCHPWPPFVIIFCRLSVAHSQLATETNFVRPGDTPNPDIHPATKQTHLSIKMPCKSDSWYICAKSRHPNFGFGKPVPILRFLAHEPNLLFAFEAVCSNTRHHLLPDSSSLQERGTDEIVECRSSFIE
jgi:hypothetical protein